MFICTLMNKDVHLHSSQNVVDSQGTECCGLRFVFYHNINVKENVFFLDVTH